MTALLLASQAGHASVVESLLKNGAYVQHKNQVRQNGANRGLSGVGRSIRMRGCEFIPETGNVGSSPNLYQEYTVLRNVDFFRSEGA